ncbi:hypothetical protein ACFYOG_30235 [Streptomyces sp. NPDC007818]|uniref:hypothetical protein n=1 Tax=Streptomyces sp. NPDC007818 TaxID=3364780 RepID=UPI0036C47365
MTGHEIVPADGDAELDALLLAADRAVLAALEGGMDLFRGLEAMGEQEPAGTQDVHRPAAGSSGARPDRRGRGEGRRSQEEVVLLGDVVNMADGVHTVFHHGKEQQLPAIEALTALLRQLQTLREHASAQNAAVIADAVRDVTLLLDAQETPRSRETLMAVARAAEAEGDRGAPVLEQVRILLELLNG